MALAAAEAAPVPMRHLRTATVALMFLALPCVSEAQASRRLDVLADSAATSGATALDWSAYGRALFNDKRYMESAAAYQRAMQLDPSSRRVAALAIARAYSYAGNTKQSRRWVELAGEQPGGTNGIYAEARGGSAENAEKDIMMGRVLPLSSAPLCETSANLCVNHAVPL